MCAVPPERLLVLDLSTATPEELWERLSRFVGVRPPAALNRSAFPRIKWSKTGGLRGTEP